MKILITGASGFVGQALLRSLPNEVEVDVVSRNYSEESAKVNWVNTSYNTLATNSESYEAVIHLAGLAHDTSNQRDEKAYFEVNEGITKKLVNWINSSQQQSCKLIYLSSIKTYSDSEIISETTLQSPNSVYGRSKLAAEKVIKECLASRHPYHILQPVMIYGKGNKGNLPRLFKLFTRLPFPFKKYPNKRSILSINNLTAVINQLLSKNIESGKYIVSDDTPIYTYEMLQALFIKSPIKLKSFRIPHLFVKLSLRLAGIFNLQSPKKVLGDLVVSNTKLKSALGINQMPFETKNELQKLELWK